MHEASFLVRRKSLVQQPYTDVKIYTSTEEWLNFSMKGPSAPSLAGGGNFEELKKSYIHKEIAELDCFEGGDISNHNENTGFRIVEVIKFLDTYAMIK